MATGYDGAYDDVCACCGNYLTPVVLVTSGRRGWQCPRCGLTWTREVQHEFHRALRANPWRFIRAGAPQRQARAVMRRQEA